MGGKGEDDDDHKGQSPPSQQQQAQDAKEKAGKNSSCHWTPEEDKILLNHVMRYGSRYWGLLQATGQLPQRDQKSCCNRFLLLKKRCLGTTSAVVVDASHAAAAPAQPAAQTPSAPSASPAPSAPASPALQSAPVASPSLPSPTLSSPAPAAVSAAVGSAALTATRIQPSAPASSPASGPRAGSSSAVSTSGLVPLGSPAPGPASVSPLSPSLSPSPSTLPVSPAQPVGQSTTLTQPDVRATEQAVDQCAPAGHVPSGKDVSSPRALVNAAAVGGEVAGTAQVRVKAEEDSAVIAGRTLADAVAEAAAAALPARSGVACGGAGVKAEQCDAAGESGVSACSGDEGVAAGGSAAAGPATVASTSGAGGSGSNGGARMAPVLLTSVTPDLMSAGAAVAAVPLPSVIATPSERKRNNKVVACRIALLLQQVTPRPPSAPTASAAGGASAAGATGDSSAAAAGGSGDSAPALAASAPSSIRASPSAVGGPSTSTVASAVPAASAAPAPSPLGSAAPALRSGSGAAGQGGKCVKMEGADVGSGSSARYNHHIPPGQCGQQQQQQQQQNAAFYQGQQEQQHQQGVCSFPNIAANQQSAHTSEKGRAGTRPGAANTDDATPPAPPLSPAFPDSSPDHLVRCHSEPCASAVPHAPASTASASPFFPPQYHRPSPAASLPASTSPYPSRCPASAAGARLTAAHSAHVSPSAGTYAATAAASAENGTPPAAHLISPFIQPPATPTFIPASCPSANRALSPLLLSPAAFPLDDPAPVFSCNFHPPAVTGARPLPPPLPQCAEHAPPGHPLGRRPRRLAFGGTSAATPGVSSAGPTGRPPGVSGVDADVITGSKAMGGRAGIARRKRQACSSSTGGSSSVGRGDGGNDAGDVAGHEMAPADGAGAGAARGTTAEAEEEQGRADGGEALGDAGRSGSSSEQTGAGGGGEGEWERGARGDVKRHAVETASRPGSPSHAPLVLLAPHGALPAATAHAAVGGHMSSAVAGSITRSPGSSGSAFSPAMRAQQAQQQLHRCDGYGTHAHAHAHAHTQALACAHGQSPIVHNAPTPSFPSPSPAPPPTSAPMSPNPRLGPSRSAPVTPASGSSALGAHHHRQQQQQQQEEAQHAALHKSTSADSFLAGMRCLLPLGRTTSHRWFAPAAAPLGDAPLPPPQAPHPVGGPSSVAAAAADDMAVFSLPSPHHPLAASRLRPRAAPPPPLFLSASSASSLQALVEESFPGGLHPAALAAAAATGAAAANTPAATAAAGGAGAAPPLAARASGFEVAPLGAGEREGAGAGAVCEVMSAEDEEAEQERMAARTLLRVLELWPHAMLAFGGEGDEEEEEGEEEGDGAGTKLHQGEVVSALHTAAAAAHASSAARQDGVAVKGGEAQGADGSDGQQQQQQQQALGGDLHLGRGRDARSGGNGTEMSGRQVKMLPQQAEEDGRHERQVLGQKRVNPAPLDLPVAKRLAMATHMPLRHAVAAAAAPAAGEASASTAAAAAAAAAALGLSAATAVDNSHSGGGGAVNALVANGSSGQVGSGWGVEEEDSEEETAVPIHQQHHHTTPALAAFTTSATAGTGGTSMGTAAHTAASHEASAVAGSSKLARGACGNSSSSSSSSSSAGAGSGVSESVMEYLQTMDDLPGASVLLLDKTSDSDSDHHGALPGSGAVGGEAAGGGLQHAESPAPPGPFLSASVAAAAVAVAATAGGGGKAVCEAMAVQEEGGAAGGAVGGWHMDVDSAPPAATAAAHTAAAAPTTKHAVLPPAAAGCLGKASHTPDACVTLAAWPHLHAAGIAGRGAVGAAAAGGGGAVGAGVERSRARGSLGGCCLDVDAQGVGARTYSVTACASNLGF
ncbi:unnamed protein product [Closterium sp. Naga37s-1]|nr:unnamed protein product [Closterium sp. Naga37s-1]